MTNEELLLLTPLPWTTFPNGSWSRLLISMLRIPVAVAVPFFPTVYRDYPVAFVVLPPTVPFDRILCFITLLF